MLFGDDVIEKKLISAGNDPELVKHAFEEVNAAEYHPLGINDHNHHKVDDIKFYGIVVIFVLVFLFLLGYVLYLI